MKRDRIEANSKKAKRLIKLVETIEKVGLPPNVLWGNVICRMTEYAAEGYDSENALECTYDDMLDWSEIEDRNQFSAEDKELLKSHIFFLAAQDANPMNFQ